MSAPAPGAQTRRRAIPRTTKTPVRAAAKRRPASRRPAKTSRPARRRRPKAVRRPRPRAEQPLGVGVGDAFALRRLNVPPQGVAGRPDGGVREVGWAHFGELARELAARIGREFQPDVILGVVNGGVFLGGALAVPLRAEFHSIRVEKRGKRSVAEPLSSLDGKDVLVVDDVTVSGKTLGAAAAAATKAGAREVRSAAMVVRPDGNLTDFFALETNDIVVFGWDYQLHAAGAGDPGDFGV